MPAKKKNTKRSVLQQCRQLPGQLRQVCVDAALARYDRHYHPEREHHRRHIVIDIVLATALVVSSIVSLYFLFAYRQAGLHQQIDFALNPQRSVVSSGEALPVSVFVQNNTSQNLSDAYVTLPAQSGYVVTRTEPPADEDGRIMLGTLLPGASAQVLVSGYVVGPAESSVRVNAVLSYRGNALLQRQEKLVSEAVDVGDSQLRLSLDMPASLIPQQPFDFTLTYQNHSSTVGFEQMRIIPFLPAGWETLESDPTPAADGVIWELGNIGSQQSGTIRGRAVLREALSEKAVVEFRAFASPFGKPLLQDTVVRELPLYQPEVFVQLSGDRVIAELGDMVGQTLTLRNDESVALHDVAAEFALNLEVIDRQALPQNAVVRDGRVILPLTDELAAKSPLVFDVVWKLRGQINASVVFGNNTPEFRVAGQVSYRNDKNELVVIPLNPVVTQLQSDARIEALTRYYGSGGEQIGRGPLPPVVGETTKYWVFIHVANQLHPLANARVQASLPAGVDWTGRYTLTAGDLMSYDATTRRVVWNLGNIADYKTDFSGQSLSAGFELAVTPGQGDVGKPLLLLNNIELQARDQVTGSIINTVAPAVDTRLEKDAYATDDGIVRL